MRARYKRGVATRILLVRHGESEWNASGRWQGWADAPLSELGQQQAVEAAEAVGAVDAVCASDLSRAADTARIISELIGVGPVLTMEGLRERDVGEWSGLTRREIGERWPETLDAWKRGEMPPPPGGESNEAIIERVLGALRAIAQDWPHAEVLVVSHGGVIRLLEAHHGVDAGPSPANLGGVVVDIDEHGRVKIGDRVLLIEPSTGHVTAPTNL
jgi:broad specificity phosphatase PhoE